MFGSVVWFDIFQNPNSVWMGKQSKPQPYPGKITGVEVIVSSVRRTQVA